MSILDKQLEKLLESEEFTKPITQAEFEELMKWPNYETIDIEDIEFSSSILKSMSTEVI